ncbi:putative deoxyribonuclease TATDN2 [Mizuhopecten yessoensis]|nr:putative deoxyribonuclease TATDN2 [Mizuhopecten yessoensis]
MWTLAVRKLRGREAALMQAAVWLLRRPVGHLGDLREFVDMQHLLTTKEGVNITDSQTVAMRAFSSYLGEPVQVKYTVDPVNSIAALIHWKAVMLMLARMTSSEREYWRTQFPIPEEVARARPRAFDSHFHLDRTLRAMGLPKDTTFQSLLARSPMEPGKEIEVVGTCACYCDPVTYPTKEHLATLPEDMEVAVGVHPKHQYSQEQFNRVVQELRQLILLPRVGAVGEIGLDHSVPREQWAQQSVMLEKILQLVEPRHVLVLHCRGITGDSGAEAYLLLLYYVKKAVRPDQRIHLHCFSGDSYVRDQVTSAFSQLYFGFTSMAAKFNNQQSQAVRGINSERVLLETDAPYFARPGTKCSAPNQLFRTASSLARYCKMNPESLLATSVQNARRLYRRV